MRYQILLSLLAVYVICALAQTRYSIVRSGGAAPKATSEEDEGYTVSIKIAVGWLQELADKRGEAITNSTLFLPTDTAFKELAGILRLKDIQDLFSSEYIIRDSKFYVLKYHIIPDNSLVVEALKVGQKTVAKTANGDDLTLLKRNNTDVEVIGGGEKSSGMILRANINMQGDNIVQVIDTVLMPPGYNIYEDFYKSVTDPTITESLMEKTGASKYITNATLFAPVDAAWLKLAEKKGWGSSTADILKDENILQLTEILKYHVLPYNNLSSKDIGKAEASWETANGRMLTTWRTADGMIQVANEAGNSKANVVGKDEAYKGFTMHVISRVLLWEELEMEWEKER